MELSRQGLGTSAECCVLPTVEPIVSCSVPPLLWWPPCRCLDNAVMVFTSTRQEVDEQWGL